MKVRWEGKVFEVPDEPRRSAAPWYMQRSHVVKLGDEPPLNAGGFWKEPKQGMTVEEFVGKKSD